MTQLRDLLLWSLPVAILVLTLTGCMGCNPPGNCEKPVYVAVPNADRAILKTTPQQ